MTPYLDYAATTPVDPRVSRFMARFEGPDGLFANPGSDHPAGQGAAAAVDDAAQQVLGLLDDPGFRVIWTSGATEADNLAIGGLARGVARRDGRRRRLLVVATEHSAVLAAARAAGSAGMRVQTLPVSGDGLLGLRTLESALDDDVALVSIAPVNNETGVIQDIETLAGAIHAVGARLHLDAAQAVGHLPEDGLYRHADMVSLSAHKFYGPKGIGALCYRPALRLEPLLHGGGQQGGMRPGTLPVPLIAGMGEALRIRADQGERTRQRGLQQRLRQHLEALGGVVINGHDDGSAHVLNASFAGIQGTALRAALADLSVGFGSACNSRGGPSHVLRAMGRPDALAHASVRFSLGRFTTESDIDSVAERVGERVRRLRAISPVWRELQAAGSIEDVYGVTTPQRMA
ncbi:cysteine desulfurase family protein [Spiribacter onubensis]|uniref:Cysteine desulfurase family protein n=1 Tax=Spiribacter onubensis TaxID=3122420 RepID=A0ABV3S9S5_9GAMM